jgi:hypothetical protein
MEMKIAVILSKIDLAIQMVFSNDMYLLERELSERSIAFKLAEYLQPLFNKYDVDSEYNGDAGKPNDVKALSIAEKRIREIEIEPNLGDNYRISPDVIIHSRGHNDNNLVVIEIKKDKSIKKYKEFDLIKLEHLTVDYLGNHYNYKLGIALVFNTGGKAGTKEEIFYQEGICITDRQKLQ